MSSRFQSNHPLNVQPYSTWREELNNLQTNVEFLTNRINTATAVVDTQPVESYNYEPTNIDIVATSPDPIISSAHSSPQNSNITYANLSQPEHIIDDSANNAITNVTSNLNDTPSKNLTRASSIKYVNDADDEPVYYNEPPASSYVEQPAYFEQPGTVLVVSLSSIETIR